MSWSFCSSHTSLDGAAAPILACVKGPRERLKYDRRTGRELLSLSDLIDSIWDHPEAKGQRPD
jgi:hypothetical protein